MISSVVVFGSTGQTGICVVAAALQKGLKVKAFVRDVARLPEEYRSKVEVVTGDVLNEADVEAALEGVDGAVVALGTRNDLKPTTDMSEGMKNILAAMKKRNVEFVSVCLSAFLFYPAEKVPKMFIDLNADHQRMYDALKAGDRKYVAAFPPHIAAEDVAGGYTTKIDEGPGRVISKWNLGRFLVDSLSQPEFYGKRVGICNVN